MELSGPQWNSIVDFTNVCLFHNKIDAQVEDDKLSVVFKRPDENGFTLDIEILESDE